MPVTSSKHQSHGRTTVETNDKRNSVSTIKIIQDNAAVLHDVSTHVPINLVPFCNLEKISDFRNAEKLD